MNILVIGRKRNGKGEFCKALTQHMAGATHCWTSAYLVYRMSLKLGLPEETILSRKESYRPALIELGNQMCDTDPGCLVSIAMFQVVTPHIIVDGVRRINEFEKVSDWFDYIVWVERPGADDGDDNCELTADVADAVVTNSGSLHDLNREAAHFAEWLCGE